MYQSHILQSWQAKFERRWRAENEQRERGGVVSADYGALLPRKSLHTNSTACYADKMSITLFAKKESTIIRSVNPEQTLVRASKGLGLHGSGVKSIFTQGPF